MASFANTIRDKGSRIVFIVDEDDPTRGQYPQGYTVTVPPTGTMGAALRSAMVPDVLKDATSVGMIGDDNRFRTPGWDVIFDEYLTSNVGVAYGDDGFQHARLPTSWWVSRPLVDVFPLAPRGLNHLYMDNWWRSLAQGAGFLKYFGGVSIEHLHPHVTEGPNWLQSEKSDETYRRGNSRSNVRHDRDAFERWERRNRADDVRRAKSIAGSGGKRRVLADWHHPALWESLSILFEDRFGWELYSMGGDKWTEHGWRLRTGPPISMAASDYLSLEGAVEKDGHHEMTPAEYPSRPRKIVTPQEAFAMQWDFVLASVPDHQRSFSELANRIGARLLHQVGNAKHAIDQSIPQTILASAAVKLSRRTQHVIYHQEFDRTMFAPSPITEPLSVSSLMLRLDWTSCEYEWLADAPGIVWRQASGQSPMSLDYLTPMCKVADLMTRSGWIWHDKRIGDGYGHVLHNAAAMGRPLIGHASHYKGLMGEPLWEDLKTCIDLDKHEPKEALRLIRAISADPDWHGEMGQNIAAKFDQLVDFDAEADAILRAIS